MSEREIGEIVVKLKNIEENVKLLRVKLIEGNGTPSVQTEIDRLKTSAANMKVFSENCSTKTAAKIDALSGKIYKFGILLFLMLVASNAPNVRDIITFALKIL